MIVRRRTKEVRLGRGCSAIFDTVISFGTIVYLKIFNLSY